MVTKRRPPPPDGMRALTRAVHALDNELRAALERKPNKALNQLVYQLKTTRQELADVQDQLRQNTDAVTRLVELFERAPVVLGALTDAEIDRRIKVGLRELQKQGLLPAGIRV